MESSNEYSNFITPPDFVDEIKHTVLIVDVSPDELQALAMFCKNSLVYFNIYIYNYELQLDEWFCKAQKCSEAIIINMSNNKFLSDKENLLADKNTWYYGCEPKEGNSKYINNPLEYFINYIKSR